MKDPRPLVVRTRRSIDGAGGLREGPHEILARDGRIERIGPPAGEVPADAIVVDAGEGTVLPGLIDAHVHLASIDDPTEPHAYLAMLLTDPCLRTLHAAKNARTVLDAGFTTVRDVASFVSGRNAEVVALRRAIEIGVAEGPRIQAAGWITPTAGHLDMGSPTTWAADRSTVADGPWACRQVVRSLVRDGVDCIKTSSSGGSGGFGEEIWWRNFTLEELTAIADEAHGFRRRVACHAHTADAVKTALRAGIDTIEHGSELDDACIDLFLETGAILVPTLMVKSDRALQGRLEGQASAHVIRKTHEGRRRAGVAFRKALDAGVRIAVGTDIYIALRKHWGENAHELEMMVGFGMSPMQALTAATGTAAEALGLEADLGTLQEGKLADLIVVDGDPLADVAILQDRARVPVVVKGGRIVADRRANAAGGGA